VHKFSTDIKKSYNYIRRYVLNNIVIQFVINIKMFSLQELWV